MEIEEVVKYNEETNNSDQYIQRIYTRIGMKAFLDGVLNFNFNPESRLESKIKEAAKRLGAEKFEVGKKVTREREYYSPEFKPFFFPSRKYVGYEVTFYLPPKKSFSETWIQNN